MILKKWSVLWCAWFKRKRKIFVTEYLEMNPVRCFWFVSRNLNKEIRVVTSLSPVLKSMGDASRNTLKHNISFDFWWRHALTNCLHCNCSLVSNNWSVRPHFFHLEAFLHLGFGDVMTLLFFGSLFRAPLWEDLVVISLNH